jgi:hypothetical protein
MDHGPHKRARKVWHTSRSIDVSMYRYIHMEPCGAAVFVFSRYFEHNMDWHMLTLSLTFGANIHKDLSSRMSRNNVIDVCRVV